VRRSVAGGRWRTVVSVCHLEPVLAGDGSSRAERMVLDRMLTWTPHGGGRVSLSEVEDAVYLAASSFGAPVVIDPWQAVGMAERLRGRGVFVEELSFPRSLLAGWR
jgi:hypothetical protein